MGLPNLVGVVMNVHRRMFWAIADFSPLVRENPPCLYRFRTKEDRDLFVDIHSTRDAMENCDCAVAIPATHPAVRKINRQIAAGIEVRFPVSIEEV